MEPGFEPRALPPELALLSTLPILPVKQKNDLFSREVLLQLQAEQSHGFGDGRNLPMFDFLQADLEGPPPPQSEKSHWDVGGEDGGHFLTVTRLVSP